MADPFKLIDGIIGAGGDLLGGESSVDTSGSSSTTSTGASTTSSDLTSQARSTGGSTEQLVLDQAAILGIIQNVLGGPNGIASIFQGEKGSGIFNSSVASQQAGDLAAKLVAEIAQITGRRVRREEQDQTNTAQQVQFTEQERTSETESRQDSTQREGGLLDEIGDVFGF